MLQNRKSVFVAVVHRTPTDWYYSEEVSDELLTKTEMRLFLYRAYGISFAEADEMFRDFDAHPTHGLAYFGFNGTFLYTA